jgi:hypothetical protein
LPTKKGGLERGRYINQNIFCTNSIEPKVRNMPINRDFLHEGMPKSPWAKNPQVPQAVPCEFSKNRYTLPLGKLAISRLSL